MTDPATPAFTRGPTLKHVAVMTSTAAVGLMAVFAVDFLNLFYISLLGRPELTAAVGYAATVLFFATSVSIGIVISGTALTARALGARERDKARRLGGSFLLFAVGVSVTLAAAATPFIDVILTALGATGTTHAITARFLYVVVPSTPLFAIGMAATGLLRAVGDARRSMWVTLGAAFVTAALDPIFIFLLGLGLDGAAIVSVAARLLMAFLGLRGAIRIHDLAGRPSLAGFLADVRAMLTIAVPAVLTNVATPVGNVFVTAALAAYGDPAIAAWAVIGRLLPLAFAPVFALSGAIGPILGQNFGARRIDRVRRALAESLLLVTVYGVVVWAALALARFYVVAAFGLSGTAAALTAFFVLWLLGLFVFNGLLFVANAAFNNLGFPVLSMLFNWGRSTLGTIPLIWIGASLAGAEGIVTGQALGGVVFGIAAVIVAFRVVARLEARSTPEAKEPPAVPTVPAEVGEGTAAAP